MCKVNNASGNVNNTPSVMPQGGQQHQNIKSNMGQNYNLDHQPGLVHAPYISQTFPVNEAFQAFPTSQTFPTSQSNSMANTDASQNQAQGYHNMTGDLGVPQAPTPPSPPPYTNVVYNMVTEGTWANTGTKLSRHRSTFTQSK